ncbi:acyltransferase [Sinorhizobium medicae]|uniref:Acyltransferase n=3 Tax=Sinorhizobium medicae TaxID=110321 RepID=A0A6G1WIE5_9HYPH|nr:conserved hypothetical protein [Sinorhizobium medicae WSM419]MDX0406506.1 acyltransferase [Sinorhizobium medicae]MDX0413057.1 acyltransferase [Sinorhizobium medicae]MDX0418858.1 acyltransferase [Sinorhizobium medicae]MDX0425306.1 acyltransferase [Sinorhizobium medicae]
MQVRDFFRLWLWVRSRGRISIGPKCRIERGAVLDLREAGRITVGRKCRLRRGSMLIPYGGVISIGDDFSLNPYSVLYGHGGLSIGNSVRIAAGCVIIPANHVFSDPGTAIRAQGLTKLGIVIEDDVWVGANVTILDGAHISRGCVIAAGSVVRGQTEPLGIYAGVPAKLIRKRGRIETREVAQ